MKTIALLFCLIGFCLGNIFQTTMRHDAPAKYVLRRATIACDDAGALFVDGVDFYGPGWDKVPVEEMGQKLQKALCMGSGI